MQFVGMAMVRLRLYYVYGNPCSKILTQPIL